jgi:hypothetical protein
VSIRRRELVKVLGLALLAWVGLLLALGKWQQRAQARRTAAEPELVHYPGTEGVKEQTSPNLGLRKYWFRLDEEYPSKSAFYFYKNELEPKGWRLVSQGEPQWHRRESEDEIQDLFHATWLSRDGLFQLDVDMTSLAKASRRDDEVISEDREPGIRVYVALRRVSMPGLLMPRPAEEGARGRIDLP